MSDQRFRQAYDALLERMPDPPPFEAITSTPLTISRDGWRSRTAVLALSLVAVLGFVGLALLIAPDDAGSGVSGGAADCQSPPESEQNLPDSDFVLTVTPNPVSPGGQVELALEVAPDAPDEIANKPFGRIITGAVASLQCWDGTSWVETHHLFKDGLGQPFVESDPDVTITIPAVGLLFEEAHTIVVPPVPSGRYRLQDVAEIGTTSYPVFALIEIDEDLPAVTTVPVTTPGQEAQLTCGTNPSEVAYYERAETAKGYDTIEEALEAFKTGEEWQLREDWHELTQGEVSGSPVEFTDENGSLYLSVSLVDHGKGWVIEGYESCSPPTS